MSFPEPETTGNARGRTNVPLPGAEVVGILFENARRILGGASDYGPNAPAGANGIDQWQGSGDMFGSGTGTTPSTQDIGRAVSSLIGSYGGGEHGSGGVISPEIAATLKQLQRIAGSSNIGAHFGPGGGSKQSAIDDIIVQIAGQIMGPQVGGDPSRGKVSGFSQHHDVTLIPDSVQQALNAARTKGQARQMNLRAARSHDPYRNDPLHYAPIDPSIYGDGLDDAHHILNVATMLGAAGATAGALLTGTPSGLLIGAGVGIAFGVWVGYKGLDKGIHADPHKGGGFPDPEGGGGGGPRGNYLFPDPEGGGGGPRSLGEAMPDPEATGQGGPKGFGFPDPDTTGGVGPRS